MTISVEQTVIDRDTAHIALRIKGFALPEGQYPDIGVFAVRAFYEKDPEFRELVSIPQKYDEEIKGYRYVSTPDCSLYRDMPLIFQLANIAVSRSIGYHFQEEGKYVIPNVRWGDERTYTTELFGERVAFQGVDKHSIVSIGTFGQIQSAESKRYFREA